MLRDYQINAINAIKQSFKSGNKSVLLQIPTGGGKTVIFSHILKNINDNNKKAILLVHRKELLKQAKSTLEKLNIQVGLIASGERQFNTNIKIASVNTLVKRLKDGKIFDPVDFIISDEGHHATANSWKLIIDYFNTKHLGVTATPIRTDGTGLKDVYDDLITANDLGCDVDDLIHKGFLSDYKILGKPFKYEVKRSGNDYNKKDLEDKTRYIFGNEIKEWELLCKKEGRVLKTLVFYPSVKMAKLGYENFKEITTSGFIGGECKDRDEILNKYVNNKINVLTSCDLISEGFDVPNVECVIMMRKTQSLGLYLQQVGRALRPSPGKKYAYILDHVGNVNDHGLPNDKRHWSLEGVKKTAKSQEKTTMIQCSACHGWYELKYRNCQKCGVKREIKERKIPKTIDGELVELTESDFNKMVNNDKNKAKSYEDLLIIEKKYGYKSGWAKHIFEARENKNAIISDIKSYLIYKNYKGNVSKKAYETYKNKIKSEAKEKTLCDLNNNYPHLKNFINWLK